MTTKMNGLEFDREAIIEYIENVVTRNDCEGWHNAEMTAHLQEVLDIAHKMSEYDFTVDIWGMPDPQQGEEPLWVKVR
jgi:hypothetical protein